MYATVFVCIALILLSSISVRQCHGRSHKEHEHMGLNKRYFDHTSSEERYDYETQSQRFQSQEVLRFAQSAHVPSQSSPSYLTVEDFERGKALTTKERSANPADLREHFLKELPQKRANVYRSPNSKWPNARIPYVISPLYNNTERAVIAESIREWESKTCIRFVPANATDRDYLELTPNDGGSGYCYSYIGRRGGQQFVKMYSPTCMSVGQYVHELGHAIGFGHEHQRPDRDCYIKINWANINPQFNYAFNKYSAETFTTLDMPYDYFSIMHYPDYSYSSNGQPVFVPTYPGYFINNMPRKLTPADVRKTKKYYNC